jgi:hypothetical protein
MRAVLRPIYSLSPKIRKYDGKYGFKAEKYDPEMLEAPKTE